MVRSLRGRRGAGAHCQRHAGRERPHDVHGERRAILSRTNRRLYAQIAIARKPVCRSSRLCDRGHQNAHRSESRRYGHAGGPSCFRSSAGLYPIEANQYAALRESLEKLKLNDAALQYEPESSQALGSGFRCGFLGLLHMDIVQERLEREFGMELLTTAPTVVYQVLQRDGARVWVE